MLCGTQSVLSFPNDNVVEGPLFSDFDLTLAPGHRFEAAGPFYYEQQSESQFQWALPPWSCYTKTPDVDWTEWEILYPVLTYRRFGAESRLQLMQLLSLSGNSAGEGTNVERFTIFPLYFQQRGPLPEQNYTAVLPFYGHLKNRLFRDDIKFIVFPLYSETRKKDVVTDNYLYPIFDLRHGDHMSGWQFWPLVGVEHKTPSEMTNAYNDVITVPGYDKFFALFPFYLRGTSGLGTTNVEKDLAIIPFYNASHSPARDQTCYGWPLGYNVIHDREKKYDEHDVIWPLFVFAHGYKNVTRIFPFYSQASNPNLESDFYLWPVYKFNKLTLTGYQRERTRIFFFLYSDMTETIVHRGDHFHRVDFWPFYTYHRDANGNQRFQTLAILEPIFPNNRSMPREYASIYSFWRSEKNPRLHTASQSALWNLYRREVAPGFKKTSLFFGLFQYQSGSEGRRWRVCYLTVKKEAAKSAAPVK